MLTTVIELLAMRVWYRSLAGIRGMRSCRASPKVSATRPSPATRLPQEIIEMIFVHLIYDKHSLLTCSLTCRSWYIAAVPHLYHTLTTIMFCFWKRKYVWPKPLLHTHRFDLLPLVKKFRIHRGQYDDLDSFSPMRLNSCLLPRFLVLTNVQELEIEVLDIPKFIPKVRRYFGHLLPTVRSLTLRDPIGCHRQIIYFIGLFQHLEDLQLSFAPKRRFRKEQANLLPIPPFIPPLRGRLTIRFIKGVVFLKEMTDLFGGIRFRHMDLYFVDGMSLLLDSCAETLEKLRFYIIDPHGEQLYPKGAEAIANGFQLDRPFRTLVCPGTRRFGHSRSWHGLLMLH
jgi:hypothetical protein